MMLTRDNPRGAHASRAGVALALGLALGLGACDRLPTEPQPLGARRCELAESLLEGRQAYPVAPERLREALRHAAGPMAASLGGSPSARRLVHALEALLGRNDSPAPESECQRLSTASAALRAAPEDPATLPDRDGIGLVLILVANAIEAREP